MADDLQSRLSKRVGAPCVYREMYFFGYGRLLGASDLGERVQVTIEPLPAPGFAWPAEGVFRWTIRSDAVVLGKTIWSLRDISCVAYFDPEVVSAAIHLACEIEPLERLERMKRLGLFLLKHEADELGAIA
jgi:hypothetical protein